MVIVIEQNAITWQSEVLFKSEPQPPAQVQKAMASFPGYSKIGEIADKHRLRVSHEGDLAFIKAGGGWVLAVRFELRSMSGKGVPQGLDIGIARLVTYFDKIGYDVQDERQKKYKVRWQEPQQGGGGLMDMDETPGQWVLED